MVNSFAPLTAWKEHSRLNSLSQASYHSTVPLSAFTLSSLVATMTSSLKEKKQALDDAVAAAKKAKELDEKYKIAERSKRATARAKELDEKYKIREKFRSTVIAAKKYNDEHKVVERTQTAASSVATKAKEVDEKHKVVDRSKEATSTVSCGLFCFEFDYNDGRGILPVMLLTSCCLLHYFRL